MAAAGFITLKNTGLSPLRIRFKRPFIERAKKLLGEGSDGALYLVPAIKTQVPKPVFEEAVKSDTVKAWLDNKTIVQVV